MTKRFVLHQIQSKFAKKIKLKDGRLVSRKFTAVVEINGDPKDLVTESILKMRGNDSEGWGLKVKMGLSVVHPKDSLKKKIGVFKATEKLSDVMLNVTKIVMHHKKTVIGLEDPSTGIEMSYVAYKTGGAKLFLMMNIYDSMFDEWR